MWNISIQREYARKKTRKYMYTPPLVPRREREHTTPPKYPCPLPPPIFQNPIHTRSSPDAKTGSQNAVCPDQCGVQVGAKRRRGAPIPFFFPPGTATPNNVRSPPGETKGRRYAPVWLLCLDNAMWLREVCVKLCVVCFGDVHLCFVQV
jgi:hypothetical protein